MTAPLDDEEKALLVQAAAETVALTAEELLAFWRALDQPPALTPAQKTLGAMMRGEA